MHSVRSIGAFKNAIQFPARSLRNGFGKSAVKPGKSPHTALPSHAAVCGFVGFTGVDGCNDVRRRRRRERRQLISTIRSLARLQALHTHAHTHTDRKQLGQKVMLINYVHVYMLTDTLTHTHIHTPTHRASGSKSQSKSQSRLADKATRACLCRTRCAVCSNHVHVSPPVCVCVCVGRSSRRINSRVAASASACSDCRVESPRRCRDIENRTEVKRLFHMCRACVLCTMC